MTHKKMFGKGHILHLVDGSGFIFRAYHALPALSRSDGMPIGAVAGFCNMIFKMLDNNEGADAATHIAVIFDHKGKTFRNDIFADYKANRPPAPDDLIPQFDLIKKATVSFNLPCIEVPGYEADDVIASYADQAQKLGGTVKIFSSDKDLMQLVGNGISMYDPMKGRSIGRQEVFEKFGVPPEKVIEVQALSGDSIDNIPGAPGIGPKTAAQLITEFGNLQNLLSRTDEIKQPKRRQTLQENVKNIIISEKLVTLRKNCPLPTQLAKFEITNLDVEKILSFTQEMEFRTLTRRIIEKFKNQIGEDQLKKFEKTEIKVSNANDPILEKILNTPYEQYTTITDSNTLDIWIRKIKERGYFAIDTETTSLNELEAELTGISLAIQPGEAAYIPVGHIDNDPSEGSLFNEKVLNKAQLSRTIVLAAFKPILEETSILKIGQNIKYDIKIFYKYNIKLKCVDDTMLLSYVLHGGLHRHNMDLLAQMYLNHDPIKIKSLIGSGKTAITFDKVPINLAAPYAAEDADITLRLWHFLKPQLHKNKVSTVYETMERPIIDVLSKMELTGIRVSKPILENMSLSLAQKLKVLENEVFTLANYKFNIASPKQLGDVLFVRMGLVGGKKGKNGDFSTSSDVLESLAASGNQFVQKIIDWRQLAKLKSTYTDALRNHINPITKRVHTSYVISGASTGRLSSAEPNLQNIPVRSEDGRKIREAFIAEKKNRILSLDYSQIELRILAHIGKIPSLKRAFEKGFDIHAMTASEMFSIPLDQMTPEIRRRAKAINFGVIYGISAFGLANNLKISRDEAKNFIETYFARFPEIRTYMQHTVEFAKSNLYVQTLFGRRIHTPSINLKGHTGGFAQRAAINAPIQGSAADIIRRAMIRVPKVLKKHSLSAKMLLQVHDELIFEVPDDEIQKTTEIIKNVMEFAPEPILKLDVPLVVDVGVGKNWSESH